MPVDIPSAIIIRLKEHTISAHEQDLCQLTSCFELQSRSESKGKGLKIERTSLTLKGGSKVKSEDTKRFVAHNFPEVVSRSQTKTNNKKVIGY